MKCNGCGKSGHDRGAVLNMDDAFMRVVEPEVDIDEPGIAIFQYGGESVCFVCLCKVTTTCVGCLDETDTLYKDTRCSAHPMLCRECYKSPRRTHLAVCESNGCMTIEELAEDEQEAIESGLFD